MNDLGKGCIPLFEVAGIKVLLHWSWFVVAVFEIQFRFDAYSSLVWNAAEYLSLFAMVLLHEFGHAFACRQVGGKAEKIVLWPLGGIAYVAPPARPGALLWSIAAGPLVNVALIPITIGLWWLVRQVDWASPLSPAPHFCFMLAVINMVTLAFNLLPIYPLDGGQMLHALLWYVLGRARSLAVCCVLGLLGAAGLFVLGIWINGRWLLVVPVFLGIQAVFGFRNARILAWLQPVLDHCNRAVATRNTDPNAVLIACTRALQQIPAGHKAQALPLTLRATILADRGNHAAAVVDYDEAIRLLPGQAVFYLGRGHSCARLGEFASAVEDYLQAIQLDPKLAAAQNNLAWLMATCPDPDFRDGDKAVAYALSACQVSNWEDSNFLGTLAAAYAETGDYAAAVSWQKKALEDEDYREQDGKKADERLLLFEAGKPYREEVEASLPR